jgi:hypothetical protein
MVGFTQEQSCTDDSTEARFSQLSVHPTPLRRVGPTRHNGSARSLPNPNPFIHPPPPEPESRRTPPSSRRRPPHAYLRALQPLRRPPALDAGHLRCLPAKTLSRARCRRRPRVFPPPLIPVVRCRDCSSTFTGGCARTVSTIHSCFSPSISRCGEVLSSFPSIVAPIFN